MNEAERGDRGRSERLATEARASIRDAVWCPEPRFDMGVCEECGRTTVDHLVDLNNAMAECALRGEHELQSGHYFGLALDLILESCEVQRCRRD